MLEGDSLKVEDEEVKRKGYEKYHRPGTAAAGKVRGGIHEEGQIETSFEISEAESSHEEYKMGSFRTQNMEESDDYAQNA